MSDNKNDAAPQFDDMTYECPVCHSTNTNPTTNRQAVIAKTKLDTRISRTYLNRYVHCLECGYSFIPAEMDRENARDATASLRAAKCEAAVKDIRNVNDLIRFALSNHVAGPNADPDLREIAVKSAQNFSVYVPEGVAEIKFPNGITAKKDLILYVLINDVGSDSADQAVRNIALTAAADFDILLPQQDWT